MKSFSHCLFLLVLTCSITTCTKDGFMPVGTYIDIGSYSLLQSSINRLPYPSEAIAIFIDSMDAEIPVIIKIHADGTRSISGVLQNYDVFEPGDTVQYKYNSEVVSFYCDNDSLDVHMRLDLKASPYGPDPATEFVADVVSILFEVPSTTYHAYKVFYHVLEQRSWPQIDENAASVDSIHIHGRTFVNLLHSEYPIQKSDVYYSYMFGIVSFTDHAGKRWRFDRFE